MSKLLSLPLLALALLALAPEAAMAHSGHAAGGFSLGFMHPLVGLDHVLAMVAVGLFAWHLGGKALWLVPTAFVVTMAVGGAVGMAGTGLPLVEIGIALSIVVIGGLVALRRTMPTEIAMTVVAVFALFHGHAHGAEMGQAASGLVYGLGFLLGDSTAAPSWPGLHRRHHRPAQHPARHRPLPRLGRRHRRCRCADPQRRDLIRFHKLKRAPRSNGGARLAIDQRVLEF